MCNTCDKSFEYSEKVICLIKHIDITDPQSEDKKMINVTLNPGKTAYNNLQKITNLLNSKLVSKFDEYIENNTLGPDTLRKQFEDIDPRSEEPYDEIDNIQGKIILDTEVKNFESLTDINKNNSFKYNLTPLMMNDFNRTTRLYNIKSDKDFTVYQFHLKIEPIEPFEHDGKIDKEKQKKYIDFICNISDHILDDQGILNDKCVIMQPIMSMIKLYFISNNIIFNCPMTKSCNAEERYRHLYF